MSKIIKLFLLSMVICLGLAISINALAQEEIIEEVILDETVEAEDLDLKEPWLLPDNPFYFIKDWGRGIRSVFTFNKVKKAELESKYANERLLEIRKMVEKNKDPEEIKKATEKYKKTVEKVKSRTEKIKEKAQDNPEVEKFLDKYTSQQVVHQKVLEKLEEQVPSEVYEKIKEARERHLEKFGEVMTGLEDREEKIRERLEKTFEEQEGSKYKNFKNLEVLIELEEKVPERAREAIRRAEENSLKRLQGDLEKMSPEDQERFKEYVEQISGDKEKHLEILENLRAEVKEKPELEEKLREARAHILKEVPIEIELKRLDCPEIKKPDRDFCQEGRIIVARDERNCVIDFKCVIPAEIEIPPTEEPQPVCYNLWDPVCGVNGKTYTNKCFARLAGVEIDYSGKCRERECNADADCPQPKCGPAGTTSVKCIGVWAKCVEGKCIIAAIEPEPRPEPRPEVCPTLWEPVCGEDGKTYSNECYARIAGVRVAYKGRCEGKKGCDLECEKYRYSTCPEGCVKRCLPSSCLYECTDDCDGPGSCSCP